MKASTVLSFKGTARPRSSSTSSISAASLDRSSVMPARPWRIACRPTGATRSCTAALSLATIC